MQGKVKKVLSSGKRSRNQIKYPNPSNQLFKEFLSASKFEYFALVDVHLDYHFIKTFDLSKYSKEVLETTKGLDTNLVDNTLSEYNERSADNKLLALTAIAVLQKRFHESIFENHSSRIKSQISAYFWLEEHNDFKFSFAINIKHIETLLELQKGLVAVLNSDNFLSDFLISRVDIGSSICKKEKVEWRVLKKMTSVALKQARSKPHSTSSILRFDIDSDKSEPTYDIYHSDIKIEALIPRRLNVRRSRINYSSKQIVKSPSRNQGLSTPSFVGRKRSKGERNTSRFSIISPIDLPRQDCEGRSDIGRKVPIYTKTQKTRSYRSIVMYRRENIIIRNPVKDDKDKKGK